MTKTSEKQEKYWEEGTVDLLREPILRRFDLTESKRKRLYRHEKLQRKREMEGE